VIVFEQNSFSISQPERYGKRENKRRIPHFREIDCNSDCGENIHLNNPRRIGSEEQNDRSFLQCAFHLVSCDSDEGMGTEHFAGGR
jgi:hypothetical protein